MAEEESNFLGGPDVGFVNGSIRLEEIPPVYYSGQTINGSVIFDLREPLSFTALNIQFVGEANVVWSETEVDDEVEREVKYRGHEEYFNYTETLAGGFGTSVQLPRTYQNFPFKFQIPFITPSSFEGSMGSVKYTITATMLYPDMRKEEIKREFTVVSPLDLNTGSPRIKEPVDMEFEEIYSCWCSSAPVTVRVRLPAAGWCPGQHIPVAVEVNNESNIEITKMIFQIVTRELYRSRQPPSEYVIPEKVLVTSEKGAILSNSKRNFTCNVPVPDMIAPYLEHCSIIDVGYFFRVTIKLSGCKDDIYDETEICLGLVPVKETLEGEFTHPMASKLPSGPIPVNDGTVVPTGLPVPNPSFRGSNISIHKSQQNISQSSAYTNCPPPYPGSGLMPGNQYPGYAGSNTSINRSQQNIPQSTGYPDAPPPYPGNLPGSSGAPGSVPKPYNIGFAVYSTYEYSNKAGGVNTSSSTVTTSYPPANNTPMANVPYVPSPYPPGGFAPSAPSLD